MKKIVVFWGIFVVAAFADSRCFLGVDAREIDTLWIHNKQKLMNVFFKENPIDWNQEGTFLFIDDNYLIRLFTFNGNTVNLYQLPRLKPFLWKAPTDFLKIRDSLFSSISSKNCYTKILDEEKKSLYVADYPLKDVPDIILEGPCFYGSYIQKNATIASERYYFGFQRKNGKLEYFVFRDFRENEMKLNPPLDKIDVLLTELKKNPFSIELEDCQ